MKRLIVSSTRKPKGEQKYAIEMLNAPFDDAVFVTDVIRSRGIVTVYVNTEPRMFSKRQADWYIDKADFVNELIIYEGDDHVYTAVTQDEISPLRTKLVEF